MRKMQVTTGKQQVDAVLAYSERLEELPLTDLLEEAKQLSGFSKEKMLVTALAKRLEIYMQEINCITENIVSHLEVA